MIYRLLISGVWFASMISLAQSQEIPITGKWKVNALSFQEYTLTDTAISLRPTSVSPAMATQRIKGPFTAGELLRFSAHVDANDVHGDKGRTSPLPYEVNMDGKGACLAIVQLNAEGRPLTMNASPRLLGTTQRALSVEITVQEDVGSIELQLRATDMIGTAQFSTLKLEQPPPGPLHPLPEARIMKNKNGGVTWQVNGERLPSVVYFGNNQFNRDERILEEIHKAEHAGVPVFSFNLYLPALVSNQANIDIIARFMDAYPEAFFIPRLWLGPGGSFQRLHADETMMYAEGREGSLMDSSSPAWHAFTEFNLRELIKLIQRSPYAHQFIGLKLLYYQTGEWIFWEPDVPAGFGEVTRLGFTEWLKAKYGSKDAVAQAWNQPLTSFEDVTVPSVEERNQGTIGAFRDPNTQQRVIDFSRFYNTENARTINRFAKAVKEATDNRSLVGTFYGYIFELAWTGNWLQQAGHLGLEELYRSPYIDMLGCPYSYHPSGRGFGLPVDMHGPFDGAAFYGKATMLEEDTYTHLADKPGPKAIAPGYDSRTKNMTETLAVLRRNLGVNIARNQIHLWQNLFSEGRFNAQEIWDMYRPYLAWMKARTAYAPFFRPDVAVLADPMAIPLLKNNAYGITERWLYQTRFFLNRTDASIGWYHQSELEYLPDSVRCLIFLNPYQITPEQQAVLRNRFMRDGRMIIFCYMPNVFDASGFNPAGREITGMKLDLSLKSLLPESRMTGELGATLKDRRVGRRQYGIDELEQVSPYIEVNDPDAITLAHYAQNGKPSSALKAMNGWTSVFLGTTGLPASAWRELFRRAGVHLYLSSVSDDFDQPDFIEAGPDFLMVQSAKGGKKTIHFPRTAERIFRFDTYPPTLIAEQSNTVEVDLRPGIPAFFVYR